MTDGNEVESIRLDSTKIRLTGILNRFWEIVENLKRGYWKQYVFKITCIAMNGLISKSSQIAINPSIKSEQVIICKNIETVFLKRFRTFY